MKDIQRKDFNVIWDTYCSKYSFGNTIIDKQLLASESDIPILWAMNNRLKARIISLLIADKGVYEEHTFLSYRGSKDKHKRIQDRKYFGRVRGNKFSNIVFSNDLIKTLTKENFLSSTTAYLKDKVKEIRLDYSMNLASECISNRPNRKAVSGSRKNDKPSQSVRTISGGLYGLGKNRKH